MFETLLEYLEYVEKKDVSNIDLETLALANAIYRSYPEDSPGFSRLSYIDDLTKYWIAQRYYEGNQENPKRQQVLLRKILDKLVLEGIETFNSSEVNMLLAVHSLLTEIDAPTHFERLHYLFERNLTQLIEHGETLDTCVGLETLPRHVTFITAKELEKCPQASIDSFGGVSLTAAGHVYQHQGDLKILDYIPDDSLVMVEDGSCAVSGYVFGRLFVAMDADVSRNIGGTIIAGLGDIRAGSAINNSRLISKWGEICLDAAEDPTLIFAARKITITGDAYSGNYIAPIIDVHEKMVGGTYQFTDTLKATNMESTDSRPLIMAFQEEIGPEMYGNMLSKEARRHLAHIRQLEARQEHFTKLMEVAYAECENYANNGMIYLLGGENLLSKIENISRLQRRLAFLSRILSGIESISRAAEARIIDERQNEDTDAPIPTELAKNLSEEWTAIKNDTELDNDVKTEGVELQSMTRSLMKRDSLEPTIVSRLKDKRAFWYREIVDLVKKIQDMEEILRKSIQNPNLFQGSNAAVTKVQTLGKLLTHARSEAANYKLAQRAISPFIKIMLRSIDNRRQQIEAYKATIKELQTTEENLKNRLMLEHQLKLNVERDGASGHPHPPQATGHFCQGAILCANVHEAQQWIRSKTGEADPEKLNLTVIRDSSQATRCYTLEDGHIVEGRPAMA